jgi:hypothetical protein
MDLTYANQNMEDIGVLQNCTFDLAFGEDENNFELTVDTANHVCRAGYYAYVENTEYGGVIDKVKVDTKTQKLVYAGRTWHGILESKILQPDSGADYLTVSGEANQVIDTLVSRSALGGLFRASTEDSDLTVKSYQMYRYIGAYSGIKNMLANIQAKLLFNFANGMVTLSAVPAVDHTDTGWTWEERDNFNYTWAKWDSLGYAWGVLDGDYWLNEFDSDRFAFAAEKNYRPVNHLICLGQGDLKDRCVIHLFADSIGNISYSQTLFGLDEVTEVYDYPNAESADELDKSGRARLAQAGSDGKLDISLDPDSLYDIGDFVGAREYVTGIFVKKAIAKKIIFLEKGLAKISYKVGG